MVESDEPKKSPDTPSWQSRPADRSSTEDTHASSSTPDQQSTVEQAKVFLQDDEVRNASTDKKIAFLERKGLGSDDIQKLLGVIRNVEASSPTAQKSSPDSPPLSPPPPPSPPPAPPSPPQTSPLYNQDAPPVITYPEFLTTAPQPTPLVTKPGLLTTLYIFSGLSALLYGTSNYLVTPMIASLTSSRISLHSTASGNLTKLVSKLEGLVSEIPPTTMKPTYVSEKATEADEDSDSDPTELFHRDIGVQTSFPSTPGSPALTPRSSGLDTQSNNLRGLKASLQGLIEDNTNIGHEYQELDATIGVLKEYCEGLTYVVPTPAYGFSSYSGNSRPEEKDDEIAKTKAAIRGVKGVLLSARTFPGGVRTAAR